MRRDFVQLHQKMNHIKQLVQDYDDVHYKRTAAAAAAAPNNTFNRNHGDRTEKNRMDFVTSRQFLRFLGGCRFLESATWNRVCYVIGKLQVAAIFCPPDDGERKREREKERYYAAGCRHLLLRREGGLVSPPSSLIRCRQIRKIDKKLSLNKFILCSQSCQTRLRQRQRHDVDDKYQDYSADRRQHNPNAATAAAATDGAISRSALNEQNYESNCYLHCQDQVNMLASGTFKSPPTPRVIIADHLRKIVVFSNKGL